MPHATLVHQPAVYICFSPALDLSKHHKRQMSLLLPSQQASLEASFSVTCSHFPALLWMRLMAQDVSSG